VLGVFLNSVSKERDRAELMRFCALNQKPRSGWVAFEEVFDGAVVTRMRGGSMFAAWVFFNVQHCETLVLGVEAVCFLLKQLFGKSSSNVQINVRDAENQCSDLCST